jgi:hypothetical protein
MITRRTTRTTRNYAQVPNYPQQGAYQGQQPYGYQQGYAQPPPQYGYGATNPTLAAYQPSGTTSSAPAGPPAYAPPPYEPVAGGMTTGQGNSDKKKTGAVPTAPTL